MSRIVPRGLYIHLVDDNSGNRVGLKIQHFCTPTRFLEENIRKILFLRHSHSITTWMLSLRSKARHSRGLEPEKPYTASISWHYNIRVCTFTQCSASGIGAWSCDFYVADNTTATYFKTSWYQVPQICR